VRYAKLFLLVISGQPIKASRRLLWSQSLMA
jgi:hypothetical protein